MIAVLQRVSEASVSIEKKLKASIGKGLLILVGIDPQDNSEDIEWLSKKIVNMRIFQDDEGKMNRSLLEVNGNILLVSQFTLHASTKKGNRPSFINAARPEIAIPLYEQLISTLEAECENKIQTGEFGADMQVQLINDGPVTIILDTKDRK